MYNQACAYQNIELLYQPEDSQTEVVQVLAQYLFLIVKLLSW